MKKFEGHQPIVLVTRRGDIRNAEFRRFYTRLDSTARDAVDAFLSQKTDRELNVFLTDFRTQRDEGPFKHWSDVNFQKYMRGIPEDVDSGVGEVGESATLLADEIADLEVDLQEARLDYKRYRDTVTRQVRGIFDPDERELFNKYNERDKDGKKRYTQAEVGALFSKSQYQVSRDYAKIEKKIKNNVEIANARWVKLYGRLPENPDQK